MPGLTIVVPTFGIRDGALERALASTSPHRSAGIDVLVVDNGTPDDSVSRTAAHFGIRCVREDRRRGVAAAQSAGVIAATSPFVAFLHSDDLLPGSRPWPTLAGGVVGGQVSFSGRLEPAVRLDHADDLLWHRGGVHVSGYVFDRRLLLAEPFDPHLPAWEDWDLLLRLSQRPIPFRASPQVFVEIMDDARERISQSRAMADGLVGAYAKHEAGIRHDIELLALWEFKIGRTYARARERREAALWFSRSLRHSPAHPRRLVHALRLLGGRVPAEQRLSGST